MYNYYIDPNYELCVCNNNKNGEISYETSEKHQMDAAPLCEQYAYRNRMPFDKRISYKHKYLTREHLLLYTPIGVVSI